jgi:hypothetical protein
MLSRCTVLPPQRANPDNTVIHAPRGDCISISSSPGDNAIALHACYASIAKGYACRWCHVLNMLCLHPAATGAAAHCCRQPGWKQGFFGKVMSLTTSSFASALLLDADSMPLANPEGAPCMLAKSANTLTSALKKQCSAVQCHQHALVSVPAPTQHTMSTC